MTDDERPAWATRIRAERKARGWAAAEMARRLRDAADVRVRAQLPNLDVLVRSVRRWETGVVGVSERYRLLYAVAFGFSEGYLFSGAPAEPQVDREDPDDLRYGLQTTLSFGAMVESALDDWELTALRHGRIARSRPASLLLSDLTADLAVLRQALDQHRSASALRRLSRVAAQMSGLMCLAYVKLDDRRSFRRWARTARTAVYEAGDPVTHSWVLAQEAYGHYYADDFTEAVTVADRAQQVASPCVGAVLAAALEARAHAALGPGRARHTHAALAKAEDLLGALTSGEINASAFGYSEAQLRFHQGSALTHLGETANAWQAQRRALELCPPHDYMDRALTRLDRTICLVRDGDISGALEYAVATFKPLTDEQREGIVSLHGQDVLRSVPARQRKLPAARQLHELLDSTAAVEGGAHR